jgi:hypothetical protein
MVVSLLALRTGRLYHQEIYLVIWERAAVGIGMVAAVVIGIWGALDPAVKPFGTTVKKASKKLSKQFYYILLVEQEGVN